MSAVRQELPSGHVPEQPAPFAHRGPDGTRVFGADDHLYVIDDADPMFRYLIYDGAISEVVR